MKKTVFLLVVSAMLLSLCACGANGMDKSKLPLSEYDGVAVNEQVQMFILQRTITDETESAALRFQNLTDKAYTFDAGQRLEVLLDGNWYVIPAKSEAMTMAVYHLPAGGMEEGEFIFAGNYEKLPEGSYRMMKLFVNAEGEQAVAAAEFSIGRG